MNTQILEEAGLTKNEAKVYQALLELGPSLAGQVSRKTGMHRRTVYDTTEMLIKKGLVGYILKNNRRLFQASNPSVFLNMIREKEHTLQEILPEMMNFYQKTREKEETNFYKGRAGLKAVFQEQLDSKDLLILGASQLAYETLKFYFKWYDKARKTKKINARIIAQDRSIKNIPLADIRYLPEKYSSPMAVNVYGNKVAIILWSNNPLAIVINNKEISQGYRNYFELVWKQAKP